MRNAMIALATLLVGVSLGLPSFAQWATPGAACTQEGANANSNGFLTCTGGVWVSNAVLMGTTSATCDSTKAGYIRYTGGQFEGCNGTGWIQLASSSKLRVYTSDGTTVLGNYLGTLNALDVSSYVCAGILYADETTGVIKMLSSQECGEVSNGTVYFSGSNCTGTPYMRTSGGHGLCCTGLVTCMTSKCKPVAGTESSHAYVSYRQSTGNCVSGSASVGSVLTQPILCGESPCIVK
mgnify:CR=1 FL=1